MRAMWTITLSAVVAGALDISTTGLVRRAEGVAFQRLLQFVASGAMGTAAFEGGANAAAIGFALHFLIATIWAALYFSAANYWPVLMREPLLCGVLYGCTVHLVMSRVVVPLSCRKEAIYLESLAPAVGDSHRLRGITHRPAADFSGALVVADQPACPAKTCIQIKQLLQLWVEDRATGTHS
jgi:hypothetical protein